MGSEQAREDTRYRDTDKKATMVFFFLFLVYNISTGGFGVFLHFCMYSPGHNTSPEGLHRWCWGGPEKPSGTGSCLLPLAGRPCSPRSSLRRSKPGTYTHRSGPMLQGSAAWLPGKHRSTAPAASTPNGNAWLLPSQLLLKEVCKQGIPLLLPLTTTHSTGVRRHAKVPSGGVRVSLEVAFLYYFCLFLKCFFFGVGDNYSTRDGAVTGPLRR